MFVESKTTSKLIMRKKYALSSDCYPHAAYTHVSLSLFREEVHCIHITLKNHAAVATILTFSPLSKYPCLYFCEYIIDSPLYILW